LFNVDFKRRNCPAHFFSVANATYSDDDIFNGISDSVNMINWFIILLIHTFINCLNFSELVVDISNLDLCYLC